MCWCSACSITSGSRRPPSCCTSARRCATPSGRGPTRAVEAIAGEPVEPELDVDLFGLLAAFRRVLERAKDQPQVVLPPEQMSIETRIEQMLARLSDTRGVRLRGTVRRRRFTRRPDRHVPGPARDDPAEAGARVPARRRPARFASTSGPGRVTRRIPIHDPEDEYKAIGRRTATCRRRRPTRRRRMTSPRAADDAMPRTRTNRHERRDARRHHRAAPARPDEPAEAGDLARSTSQRWRHRRRRGRTRRGGQRCRSGRAAPHGAGAARGHRRGAGLRLARAAHRQDAAEAAVGRAEGGRAGGASTR